MRAPCFYFLIFLSFVCCDPILGQRNDSVIITSTIHVAKPDIKAHVEVSEEYSVYMKKSEAPKLGHITGSKLKYIKSKDLRSFGQNQENPMPLVSALYFIKKRISDSVRVTDSERIYDDGWPKISLHDSVADLSKYLEDTTHFTFPSVQSNRIDSIQLKIVLDKRGNYKYTFASMQDSLHEGGEKCMEALTSIHKWQPAHIDRTLGTDRHPRIKTRKAYSEILVTVVLSPFRLSDMPEESTEK